MISLKQFKALQAGDLVLWRGKFLRTVLEAVKSKDDCGGHAYMSFAIRRRSWTGRAKTVYSFHDLRKILTVTGKKTRGPILKSEVEVLKASGFNPRRELKRELKDAKETSERMALTAHPRPLCDGYHRLKKLAEKI